MSAPEGLIGRPQLTRRARSGAPTKPLLYGNIIHELLQAALQTRDFSAKSLRAALDEIINRPAMQLDVWAADIGLEELRAEVWEKVQMGVVAFGEKWVAGEPRVGETA